jgi:hypothetical protein
VDQFMNREEGIKALREASEALSRASAALHERADGRENLQGATTLIVGGLGQAVESLADHLEDDVAASETPQSGTPAVEVGQVWTGITGNRLVVREVTHGRARLSYESDPGDEAWEDVEDVQRSFTLAG